MENLSQLTKDEAEAISKFLTEKLWLRECWHEFFRLRPGIWGCSCGYTQDIPDDKLLIHHIETQNPSILDADFREEVTGAFVETDEYRKWLKYWRMSEHGAVRFDSFEYTVSVLTNPNKWVFMILKEMNYE